MVTRSELPAVHLRNVHGGRRRRSPDLDDGVQRYGLHWTGPVEDFVNKSRTERGLPLRESYAATKTIMGKQEFYFNHVNPKRPDKIYHVVRPNTG